MKANRLLIGMIMLLLWWSCTDTPEVRSVNGVWEQLGYGKTIEIKNDSVKIYDICSAGCLLLEQVPLKEMGQMKMITTDTLLRTKNIKTYKYVKQQEVPSQCLMKQDKDDYLLNFEFLWNTFNENYSFFEERQVDWDTSYEFYKNQITSETTEIEFFILLETMLDELQDGHVKLYPPENLEDSLNVIEQQDLSEIESVIPKIDHFTLGDQIISQYCETVRSHNGGIVKWGITKDNIGYVQFNAMWLLAYYDIPKGLSLREFFPLYNEIKDQRVYQRQDEIDGADQLMDTIISELINTNSIIIDLRFNQGGKDEAGLEILGHFVSNKTKIASKKARYLSDFTNKQSIYVEPRKPLYSHPIYILTSPMTASAAEVAAIGSMSIENATIIGSSTEGVLSDGLDKKLPIGWYYTLSNEIYTERSGKNYEGIGIPPDIELGYSDDRATMLNGILEELETKGDRAIEKVIEIEREIQ